MLNLLPKESREKQKLISKAYQIIVVYVIILVAFGLGAAALATYNYTQQSQLDSIKGEREQLEAQRASDSAILAKAAYIEDRLTASTQYKNSTDWNRYLSLISENTPQAVTLSSIKYATDSKTAGYISVSINGSSPDRRSIVLFNNKLAENANIVNPTIMSITDGADSFTFSIQLSVKEKLQ